MSKLRFASLVATLVLAALPAAAWSYPAYTTKTAHLRAGPARDYPVVAVLAQGTALDVQGCLSDFSWCDVIALGDRGWLYAGNIDYVYDGAPVTILDYGPELGIGIIGFSLGEYWDNHYRGRPWYHDRDDWIHRPRPVQPPLPPRPRVPPGEFPPHGPVPHPPRPPREPVPHPPPQPPHPRPEPPRVVHPPVHVPPPRSAEPGRPPMTEGDRK